MEMNKHGQSSSDTGGLDISSTIPLYSEEQAEALKVKLGKKETFGEAAKVLIAWIESGQRNESNSKQFRDMLKLCQNYMRELQKELEEILGESQKAQINLQKQNSSILLHLDEIEDLFRVIDEKDCDFAEAQLQKIQEMRKELEDLQQRCSVYIKTEEEESSGMADMDNEDVQSENVAHEVPTEAGSSASGLNTGEIYENLQKEYRENEKEILRLRSELENRKKADEAHQKKMKIVSLLSVLLFDNPDGLNIDSIYSHLNADNPDTSKREIEEVLRENPEIFEESSPTEASEEKKWTYIAINKETLALLLKEE